MPIVGGQLDVYDNGNGSVTLAWPQLASSVDSYNVYVNGVLNQNVATQTAVVSGLQGTSYSSQAAVPAGGNSQRPQNMPPNGEVTDSTTYDFKVVAVKAGVEVAASLDRAVTVQPTSVMLTTPMRRPFPFPNTAPGG